MHAYIVPRPITTFRFWLFAKTGLGAPGGIFQHDVYEIPNQPAPKQAEVTEAMSRAFLRGACRGAWHFCPPWITKH